MPQEPTVPVDLFFWLMALVPIVVLLVLLAVLRWSAAQAGPVGFFIAAIIALVLFRTPVFTLAVATAKGFWDALFILYIVWTALLLYEVVKDGGVFAAFRRGISEFTPNRLVQFMAFAVVFVIFLQATTGFGTPIAIGAPLLVAMGIQPLYAVSIALIAHIWGNSYGGLAIAWITMNLVVEVEQTVVALASSSLLLALGVFFSILAVFWLFGGRRALRDGWLIILVFGALYGLGQLAIAPFVPQLAALIPATIALGVIFIVPRLRRYSESMETDVRQEILSEEATGAWAGEEGEEVEAEDEAGRQPSLMFGFLPYYGLVIFALLGLALAELVEALGQIELGLGFPEVATGYNVVREAQEVYSGLNPVSHPGTAILLSALLGYFAFTRRGYLELRETGALLRRTAGNAVPPSVAIIAFLALAQVMDHSGQTFVLAQGVAVVSPAWLYPAAAVFIGTLGAFITSSNTASNILFSPLHSQAAVTLGIGDGLLMGGQQAGGAFGNAIAPANVALGTGTTGIAGQEGAVLRIVLPWIAALTLLGAIVIVLLQFVF